MQHNTIQLPSVYLITPELVSEKLFFNHLESCLDKGISLVQLRLKNCSKRDYCDYAEKALTICHRYKAQLLMNASIQIAVSVGVDGVHLNSQELFATVDLPSHLLIGASCHSSKEIQQAKLIKTDFIVLGSVCATASHPEVSPLGWKLFDILSAEAHCPVFALGGLKIEDIPKAKTYGAYGIAAIRSLW
ncbi:MAG: thiamine phosphate synthase [Thiomargarita sp.]|nr:thiamine phosphate synthase [Thiomargarita sp.]